MRRPLALAVVLLALAPSACRQEPVKYPPECSNGPAAVRTALSKAPAGEVAIEGVKLSECLVRSQDAGPLAAFGGAVVTVAQGLSDRAARGEERALVELGFLHGAIEHGADPTVHDELKFRLDQELLRVDTRAPAFRRGQDAGRKRG